MSSSSPTKTKGSLKIFLGYAAGVGKTFQMLTDAQKLRREGVDVVVGYFEPHARPDTIALMEGLEVVARRKIEYRGARFEEMDTDAVLARQPKVCVVDEFAHTNVPGSEREKRWQDVMLLLEGGIDVLTTVNIQHLESLNDQVYGMTNVRVRETVPDWVVQQAAEVVMVDLTPRALLNRLDRGAIYQGEKVQRAKENFFKESTLGALRELALRETAFEVESRHATAEERAETPLRTTVPDRASKERILVYVTPEPTAAALIRRGKRVADYLKGECFAVAVCAGSECAGLSARQKEALEKNMNFARNLHVPTEVIVAENVAQGLVQFAREHKVTQIYLLRPAQASWRLPFQKNFVEQLARLAQDVEITIAAERGRRG